MCGRRTMKRNLVRVLALSLFCCGALILNALGQTSNTGAVSVTVLDPAGAVVPNANLELKDRETNDIRRAQTSEAGTFIFQALNFGQYQLTISAQGFQSQVFE